ncbi:MAG: S1 family peptidase [Actinomycetota bacterium]|nr:S1 family peptidase [Actinomycetota bacterium]
MRLTKELADQADSGTAGSYLDDQGDLVVTVVTRKAAAQVRAADAHPQRVDDSAARLDRVMQRLDDLAEADRAGTVQGWYVDIPSNSVVVTSTTGATDADSRRLLRVARKFGDTVRFESSPTSISPTPTDSLYGGAQYVPGSGTCSVGFNAVDSSNRNVVLSAGHCLRSGPTASRNGYIIGATRTANFPTDDFGTFWNSYPSYWRPQASVNRYNGTAMAVRGSWGNPPIGATVCKSGRTTGWTCGTLKATNQTVNYGNGDVVYGLVRHSACVEPGDSGGSNVSSGGYALGLTSGASLFNSGGQKVCGQRVGQPNVSWYQPIGEALQRNGLRLLVSTR